MAGGAAPNCRAAAWHQDRGGEDRHRRRLATADRLGQDRASAAAIAEGGRCTWFLAPANPGDRAQALDRGLARAAGRPDHRRRRGERAARRQEPAAGRRDRVDGRFARGDAVLVRGPDGHEIGRGLVAYDADDADRIMGRTSPDVMAILGIAAAPR